jgi:hypothetical protein
MLNKISGVDGRTQQHAGLYTICEELMYLNTDLVYNTFIEHNLQFSHPLHAFVIVDFEWCFVYNAQVHAWSISIPEVTCPAQVVL